MSKVLISYFSASGVTKEAASRINRVIQGDLFSIEPVDEYSEADLDWRDNKSRSSVEMQDKNSRPPVKNVAIDTNLYDSIIIGYPIWWDLAPRVINTFIEANDFTNKKVYIYATSGGSSVDNSFDSLKNEYPSINFVTAIRITSSTSDDEINEWLK